MLQNTDVQEIALDLSKSPEYLAIYANQFTIGISPIDLQISFGRITTTNIKDIPHEVLASVFLSPIQAKQLVVALANAISQYETTFGPIPILKTNEK